MTHALHAKAQEARSHLVGSGTAAWMDAALQGIRAGARGDDAAAHRQGRRRECTNKGKNKRLVLCERLLKPPLEAEHVVFLML
jgi:hypothetical protein